MELSPPASEQSEGSTQPPPAGRGVLPPSRVKASVACQECKRKKSKCSGQPICNRCLVVGTECVFEEGMDKRKGVKRKFQELERAKKTLDDIIYTFKNADAKQRLSLVEAIRKSGDLEGIESFLTQERHRLGESSASETPEPPSQLVLPRLADDPASLEPVQRLPAMWELFEPPYSVRARPWVTLTDDDQLVSRLLSFGITWVQSCFFCFDADLFLRDMRKGVLDAKYCSPLLVNILLTFAAIYTDMAEPLVPGVEMTERGAIFLKEANRLWDAEDDEPSLVKMQAHYVWIVASGVSGVDQSGWVLHERMVKMYNDLGLQHWQPSEDPSKTQEQRDDDKARCHVAWATFISSSISSMMMLRSNPLKPPLAPRPSSGKELEKTVTWWPYPRMSPEQQVYLNLAFDKQCDLCMICSEVQTLMFDLQGKLSEDEFSQQTEVLFKKLWQWRETLPDVINTAENIVPTYLGLVALHTHIFVTFTEFARKLGNLDSDQAARLRSHSLEAVIAYNEALLHFKRRFTYEMIPLFCIPTCTLGSELLVTSLDSPGAEDALLNLLTVLVQISQRQFSASALVRMFQSTVAKNKIELPASVAALLKHFEEGYWVDEFADKINSAYPIFHEYVSSDQNDPVRFYELLEALKGLSTDDKEKEGTTAQDSSGETAIGDRSNARSGPDA